MQFLLSALLKSFLCSFKVGTLSVGKRKREAKRRKEKGSKSTTMTKIILITFNWKTQNLCFNFFCQLISRHYKNKVDQRFLG